MNTPTLIGLVGKKRAGKDSFASALVDDHGFARVAFADPLKAVVYGLDPWVKIEQDETGPMLEAGFPPGATRRGGEGFPSRLRYIVDAIGWERAKEVREVRRLLQAHGVAIREHVDPEVWVDAAMRKVHRIRTSAHPRECPDCGGIAFYPPFQWCGDPAQHEDAEGVPVVVTDVRFPNEADAIRAAGGKLVRITRPGLVSTDAHVSETALDDYEVDAHVVNAGTLESLRAQARVTVTLL